MVVKDRVSLGLLKSKERVRRYGGRLVVVAVILRTYASIKGGGGGINWEFEIIRYTHYIK